MTNRTLYQDKHIRSHFLIIHHTNIGWKTEREPFCCSEST